jgi:hypothetical protein
MSQSVQRAPSIACLLALVLLTGGCEPGTGLFGGGSEEATQAEPIAVQTADLQGEAALDEGDPAQRLPDADEAPVNEDDCGRDAGELESHRAAGTGEHTGERVSFSVKFQDEVSPHRLMSAFLMPGEAMEIEPVLTDRASEFRVSSDAGSLRRLDGQSERWEWTAPDAPGIHCIQVTDTAADETVCINAFVLTPYDGRESLNGYRIGSYPTELYKGLEAYRRPAGFVEVTQENMDTWVSPHFQLKQFLCKQESGWPKYLLLRTRLLLKLEMLLEEVNEQGIPADSFYVMSGYRTPHYNATIGNETTFSRHTFGDAADIFIDQDGNGVMDDIDGSGQVTADDARLLWNMIDGMKTETWYGPFVGGLGLYPPAPHRGPFVHTDTRGFEARW